MKKFCCAAIFLVCFFSGFYLDKISFAQSFEETPYFYLPLWYEDRVQGSSWTLRSPLQVMINPPAQAKIDSESADTPAEYTAFTGLFSLPFSLDASFTESANPYPSLLPLNPLLTMSPSRYIPLTLRLDPLAFQELLKAPREEQTSFVLQVIDKEKRIFRVTLEDRDLGILSFRVGPEGVYGLAGNFRGRDTEMEWNGAYFRVSVSGDEQELKVKLVPLSLPSALEARYSRHFVFGDFLAELKFDFVEKQPCLELKLKNGKEEEALKAKLDTAGIYLSGDLPLVDGERGKVTLEAGGFRIRKARQKEGWGWHFKRKKITAFPFSWVWAEIPIWK